MKGANQIHRCTAHIQNSPLICTRILYFSSISRCMGGQSAIQFPWETVEVCAEIHSTCWFLLLDYQLACSVAIDTSWHWLGLMRVCTQERFRVTSSHLDKDWK